MRQDLNNDNGMIVPTAALVLYEHDFCKLIVPGCSLWTSKTLKLRNYSYLFPQGTPAFLLMQLFGMRTKTVHVEYPKCQNVRDCPATPSARLAFQRYYIDCNVDGCFIRGRSYVYRMIYIQIKPGIDWRATLSRGKYRTSSVITFDIWYHKSVRY